MRHLAAAAAALALFLAGCNGSSGTTPGAGGGAGGGTPAAGPVKIGVAGPITGNQAKNGQDLKEGSLLAVEEWNAKGGVLGRTIELVVRDDEAQDKNAPAVAQELVNAGVVGVIGHFNSGCTIPASEKYHEAGIVTITPASTNTYVTDRKYPDVFRVCGRDDQQGRTTAYYISDVFKAKRVAIFDNKTAYGKGLADDVAKNLEGRVEIVIREGFDELERNFRPYLTKLKEANVDLWYFGGIYDQAAPMLIQASQLGIKVPMMSGDGVHGYQEGFIDKVGAAANGTLTTFPDASDPGFLERYKKRFNSEPGPYAIFSYACAQILLEGIQAAGAADGTKVAAALHERTFQTPVGPISFDERGDVKALDYYKVWVVRDGKHVLRGPK